jgi:hypothetical protein
VQRRVEPVAQFDSATPGLVKEALAITHPDRHPQGYAPDFRWFILQRDAPSRQLISVQLRNSSTVRDYTGEGPQRPGKLPRAAATEAT